MAGRQGYQYGHGGYAPQHMPDMIGNAAHTTTTLPNGVPSTMQPQYDTRVAPYQNQAETAQTWDLAHADAAEMISKLVHQAVEGSEGWWFTFAPIEISPFI